MGLDRPPKNPLTGTLVMELGSTEEDAGPQTVVITPRRSDVPAPFPLAAPLVPRPPSPRTGTPWADNTDEAVVAEDAQPTTVVGAAPLQDDAPKVDAQPELPENAEELLPPSDPWGYRASVEAAPPPAAAPPAPAPVKRENPRTAMMKSLYGISSRERG